MITGYVVDCLNCGYMSTEIQDFVEMWGGPLCHTCYDELVYDADSILKEEETRKAEAFAYVLNTDYLE